MGPGETAVRTTSTISAIVMPHATSGALVVPAMRRADPCHCKPVIVTQTLDRHFNLICRHVGATCAQYP
jgi:hypothetical protein